MENFESEGELINHIEEKLDDFIARLENAFDPIWPSQVEYGKTIITLSSGALILSITLIQFLDNQLRETSGNWLLLVSWILLCISILAGAYRFNIFSKINAYKYNYLLMRGKIKDRAIDLFKSDQGIENLNEIFKDSFRNSMQETTDAINAFQKNNYIMVGSFTFGILILTLFACINLPL